MRRVKGAEVRLPQLIENEALSGIGAEGVAKNCAADAV
jgi:hypothetical protein